jgi:hypothetical protein
MAPKPSSIIAQVDGSGTAAATPSVPDEPAAIVTLSMLVSRVRVTPPPAKCGDYTWAAHPIPNIC